MLEESIGLQRAADDLLHLARADIGPATDPVRELMDLDDVILRIARRARSAERVTIDTTAVGPAAVHSDRDQLTRLVGNITDNAVRHARTRVALTLTTAEDRSVRTIADDGSGVAVADHERIFERFVRADDARRTTDGGTGLGLAIARDIAERHGGIVEFDCDAPSGARFVVIIPA